MLRPRRAAWAIPPLLAMLAIPAPGRAQSLDTPEDLVRWIYLSRDTEGHGLAWLEHPDRRYSFMTPRLAGFYDAHDTWGDDINMGCRFGPFDLPVEDFDPEEIRDTLHLRSLANDDRAWVSAAFEIWQEPVEVLYTFAFQDGVWRLDDLTLDDGAKVSQMTCIPRERGPEWLRGNGYCYQPDWGTLVLDQAGHGGIRFRLETRTPNGAYCGARGQADAVTGAPAWAYFATEADDPCRLTFELAEDSGIRLLDPDAACQPRMCGQHAALDGVHFPARTRIDCADLPG